MPNYNIRIFKAWGNRDVDRRWSNQYEVTSDAATPWALQSVAEDIVDAEREIHLGTVNFLSAVISTAEIEGPAYDPSSFYTLELNVIGLRNGLAAGSPTALDSNVCLMAKFSPLGGRTGKRFYRGVLMEGDVEMGGDGRFTFTNGSPIGPGGADFIDFATALAPYLEGGAGAATLALISVIDGATVARPVLNVTPGSIVINRRNHRYFDRGPVG